MLTSMGWIEKAVALATNPDPEVQVQGAKLLINFALSGRNRKYVHDKGLLEKVKNTKNTSTNANAKSQLEIAINNLSFPYEERYEGLDFKLEEKMPIAPAGEYEYEDESDEEVEDSKKSAIYTKVVEENKKKLESERKRIERERKEADDQLKKQQELIAKKRKEEEEQMKKKKVEEDKQRALKKKMEEEMLKKQQEEAKRKLAEQEAAALKAAEARKRIQAEEEKRRAEEEEKKKKKLEEKQRKDSVAIPEGKKIKILTQEELAAKIQRKEARRLRNEDRQKRREERARKKIEKAKKHEEHEKRKVEKARQARTAAEEAQKKKEKEEEAARVKGEADERLRKEKEVAAEDAKIKKEHEEKEAKRKAELAALEADAKKKEEEAAQQAGKDAAAAGKGKDVPSKDVAAAKAEKRVKITQEILSVEKGYVTNLSIAIRKFLNPLTISASQKKPILTMEKVKAIFSIIEIIFNYNSLLLEGLETRTKRWVADNRATPLCFGDIFVKMTDYMTCYSTYINNYNHSMETLLEAKKNNPEFAQFLRKAEADPECRMQELSSFIINPIQQLPRYIMLLTDLLRNTAPDHPDYANIGIATEKMKKLTEHVNEQKRESETTAAIVNVQHRLRGKVPQLLIPFRKLIKEGALALGDAHGIKEKEGYVFLFNDLVILAKQQKDQLKYKEHVSLQGITVEDLKDEQVKNVKNAFMMKGSLHALLSAKTPSDKTAWLQKFNAAISGKA